MPAALSSDLRERILRAYVAKEGGYGTLAMRFAVGTKTVRRIVSRSSATGSCAPLPHGGGTPPSISAEELPELRALVARCSDKTAQELADMWSELKGRAIHRSSMVRALGRAALSTKKKRTGRLSKIAPT